MNLIAPVGGKNKEAVMVKNAIEIPEGLYPAREFLNVLSCSRQPAYYFRKLHDGKMIDHVIIGPCSELPCAQGSKSIGNVMREELSCSSGTVLLVARCCGGYSKELEAEMKRLYPNVTWIVPRLRDHFGRVYAKNIADDLKSAEVICSK
ncbi:MAG: hypothetical protein ACYCZZ_00680 [Minisyncoccota bacterium]